VRCQVADWAAGKGARHKHVDIILLAPDLVHLLLHMTLDSRIDKGSKARLVGALAYFVSPIDLIPEAIVGPIGYLDDIAVACLALNSVLNEGDNHDIALEHWQGDRDLLEVIQNVLGKASDMLGGRVWAQIRGGFGKKG